MDSKNEFIGNGFESQYGVRMNLKIWQLEQALNIPKDELKTLIAKYNYNKDSKAFSMPALFVNEYTTKDGKTQKELTLKISTGKAKMKPAQRYS